MPFPGSFGTKISKFSSLRSSLFYFFPAPRVLLSLYGNPKFSSETVIFLGYDLVKNVPNGSVFNRNPWVFWHHTFFHSTLLVWLDGVWGGVVVGDMGKCIQPLSDWVVSHCAWAMCTCHISWATISQATGTCQRGTAHSKCYMSNANGTYATATCPAILLVVVRLG